MSELKPCTLIGSDKGGVGKSLVAQLVVTAYDAAYDDAMSHKSVDERVVQRLKVVEVDNQRRLSATLGSRVDLAMDAGPQIDDFARDPSIGENYYNRIYDAWNSGPSLTDFGANVTTSILNWARHFRISEMAAEDGVFFRFVSVVSPDDQALRSAFQAMKEARQALGARTELFLCFNDTLGQSGFEFFEGGDQLQKVRDLAASHSVKVMNIPFCDSKLMEWSRAHGYTIKEMIHLSDQIVQQMVATGRLDRIRSRKEVAKFESWCLEVQQQIMPLFERPSLQRAA